MKKLFILSVLVVLFSFLSKVIGQTNTIYYMGSVPQSYYLNPATQPYCNVYFGIPVVSQLHTRAQTGGLSANDLVQVDPLTDSLIYGFDRRADQDQFLSNLNDVESIAFEAGSSILSFGFRVKEMYFSFDATLRSNSSITYTKDFIEGRLKGFENGKTYDLSEGGVEHLDYSSISINISRNFGDKLQIGIRPRFLSGLGVISTVNNNTSLFTSTDEWILTADYQAKIAAVGVEIPVDEDGVYDPDGEITFDSTLITPSGYQRFLSSNRGFGIDFGAHYMPIDNLQLSLSVLDIGTIKWTENTHVASVNGSYVYDAVDIDDLTSDEGIDPFEGILDTLKEELNLQGSDQAFKTKLTPKLIVGGRYFITSGFDVGVLYRADFYKNFTDHDVILSANWHPLPFISVSGSYSILNTNNNTLGVGLGMKLGSINYYVVLDDIPLSYNKLKSDDLPFGVPLPIDQSDYNIKFGVNLVFGCNKNKRLRQDKPMFNSSDWIL